MTAPVLVFAWGNPSRGDDALGPAFAEAVEARCGEAIARGELEVLVDFQLQVEHALDLQGRRRVLFVDAAATGDPVSLRAVEPRRDESFTSHALTPEAVLHAFAEAVGGAPPECLLLSIRGEHFELGEPLSPAAAAHLALALDAAAGHLPLRPAGAAPYTSSVP